MDFSEKIAALSKKVKSVGDGIKTEEATKNALVMPFIAALGYDVFNPAEVVPEFSAPIGEYKDARIDYAILNEGKPIVLIECKALGTGLDFKHCNQLQLYFHGTEAPIAILTDGNRYRFYSDLETTNRMDTKPYMEFCLDDMDDALIPELRKLVKGKFDRDVCMSAANELKYNREFKRIMAEQMIKPHDDFARFFISQAYDGRITQNVLERFTPVLVGALEQFINDRINDRLKNAMTQSQPESAPPESETPPSETENGADARIVTLEEEKEAYYLVKSILRGVVDPERVVMRDAVNFCNILLDDTLRQPIFRLHFNKRPWKVGLFDGDAKDERIGIETLDEILPLADRIRATVAKYEAAKKAKGGE